MRTWAAKTRTLKWVKFSLIKIWIRTLKLTREIWKRKSRSKRRLWKQNLTHEGYLWGKNLRLRAKA